MASFLMMATNDRFEKWTQIIHLSHSKKKAHLVWTDLVDRVAVIELAYSETYLVYLSLEMS